uniref:Uncharacterized protein n=1 Tax=Anguilla anguilla TaxID=7936 RepID=A0A0E9T0R5_ANGAN
MILNVPLSFAAGEWYVAGELQLLLPGHTQRWRG